LLKKEKVMNWIILILAGLCEVGFASCLGKVRETSGNEMYLWFTGFVICLVVSMVLLLKATQTLPIGTAYAVWTGIGAVGTVLVGILVFKDPVSFWRVFFITTLILSIAGLKVVSSH
jgi:quaternary ammonium compound-resistance protein SugE